MLLLRGSEGRRFGGAALCLAAMLGAETARAGEDAAARPGIGGVIEVAYAMATPAPLFDSIQHAAQRAAARAALRPAAAPRPALSFGVPVEPAPGYDRVLYGAAGAGRRARAGGQ